MGLFTKTSGRGWSLDKGSGRLTINGELGDVYQPFEKIAKMVRSVVALDGARVRDGRGLFSHMKKLESADLSKLDVSECTDLSWMFYECKSLTSIDVTGWDTSSVRDMSYMFSSCKSLVSVDLASLDLSSVETLQSMFSFCEKLSCVKMGSMSAAVKLADISNLFFSCKSFVELDLRSMDVTNVQDISSMFSYCSNLRTLDLSGWDVRNIKKMVMFCDHCDHLEILDLRGWQINRDIDAGSSFYAVPKNVRILVSDKTTQSVFSEQCYIRTEYSLASENADDAEEKTAVKEEPKPEAKTEPKAEAKPEPKAETKTAVKEGPNPAITPSLNHQDEKQTTEAATTKSTPQPKQKQKEKAITKASPVKKPKQQSTTVSSQKTDIEDEKAALLEKLAKQQAEVDALKAQLAALQTNKEEKKAAGQKEEKKAARQKEESKTIAKGKKQPEKAKETTGQKEPLPSAVKVQAAQDPASTADQGEREAAYNLALMYTDGNGDVPKDYLKALELFCKAADQGHEKAQKILRSSGIHRAKTSYNVPVSHKPNPAEKKNYENKRHIKVAVIGDCLVGKTTLLSALSCYFSQNYPSYENYYMTREEIKEIQARGAHGLCKEHGYQHEPFYMFLEDPDFLYTFIEIPSVLDFMKNIQQGMYAADIAIYVATVQHGAANSSKYLQLALNACIPGFIAFQTTLEPNPDQEMIDLASFDLIGAAQNLEIPLKQTVDGTHLEYQIDEKDFTLCLAELMKEVRDTATSNVGNIAPAPDLPTLMSIKKVSRKRDGSLLALGVISRGTLLAGDSVEICGYYDTLIPATCAEIQIFNLSVPIANCGDFVSVRLTDLPLGFVIRAGQFISKPGCIRLANSITIEGNAPTWENGGRHTPFFTGYQPLLLLGPSAVSATVTEMGDMMVTPGEHFTLRLELDKPLPVIHGLRAVLCDGVIVGTGMISEYSE